MEDKFFTIDEVAKYLRIPKSTIYKLSQKGQIPSCKIGKQLRFRKSSLDDWITEKEVKFIPLAATSSSITDKDRVSAQKPKRVLLIDDDRLVLNTLARFLKSQGYLVEPVASGKEALERIENLNFDLVIADVRMPGMDGIETIKRIREFRKRCHRANIPEIIITGYIDTQAEWQAKNLGITDYVYKPFAITDFIARVKKRLEPSELN